MTETSDVVTSQLHKNAILQIHLNRPQQLNALSEEVLAQLAQLFQQAKHDTKIRALLLTGEGKGFCAGADIKQLAALDGVQGLAFATRGQQIFNELALLGKPSLAAIHGFAFGGGCELAMAATMRIAAEGTVFGQPEVKLGVIPGFGGTVRLARLVGKGRALDLCLTGRRFSAQEALQWGLLSEITTPENLQLRALTILQELISLPPVALQSMMTVIEQGYDLPMIDALALEAAHFALCCTTEDKHEGVAAFLAKRSPSFSGA